MNVNALCLLNRVDCFAGKPRSHFRPHSRVGASLLAKNDDAVCLINRVAAKSQASPASTIDRHQYRGAKSGVIEGILPLISGYEIHRPLSGLYILAVGLPLFCWCGRVLSPDTFVDCCFVLITVCGPWMKLYS